MVAWVVINHHRPRQSTPKSSSLRTLCLCVELSDAFPSKFPFVSHLPYVLPSCVSRNPFVCHSYENCRGVYQQFPFWNSTFARSAHYRSKIPTWSERDTPNTPLVLNFFSFRFLRTLLHVLYSPKTQLISFQEITHSLTKTREWERVSYFSRGEAFPSGNSIGSAGGLSAISSSCGYCRRSGSGTFTLVPFRMLMSCNALTTALPWK